MPTEVAGAMKFHPQWEIDDRVVLTAEGARANRHYWNAMMACTGPLAPFGIAVALFSQHAEAGSRGYISNKRRRAFGRPGFDYEVFFEHNYVDDGGPQGGGEWFLSRHLEKDLSNKPYPWEEPIVWDSDDS